MSYLRFLTTFFLTCCLAIKPCYARDIIVATSGANGAAGTLAAPLKTIQDAINLANPGDIIQVRAGTYFEVFRFSRSGTTGNPITLKNYASERVVIDLQGNYNTPSQQLLLQSAAGETTPIGWITVQGLEIKNAYVGLKMYNAYNVLIKGNKIYDSARQGILGNAYDTIFDGNVISHTGFSGAPSDSNQYHGMYLTGQKITVTNNIFHSNLGYGLQIAAYPSTLASQKIAAPNFGDAKFWLVSNNVFAFQRNRAGLNLYLTGATDNEIQNNIFYDNSLDYTSGANGISLVGSGPRNIIKNNLYYSSLRRVATEKDGSAESATESGGMFTDPDFTNAIKDIAYDFTLKSGSAAIDPPDIDATHLRVTTDSRVVTDLKGGRRPTGTKSDLGAYEYQSAVLPAAPKSLAVGQ